MIKFRFNGRNIDKSSFESTRMESFIRDGTISVVPSESFSREDIVLMTDNITFSELWNFFPARLRRVY